MLAAVNKPRILIVEDEAIVARDIEYLLREMGYDPVGHATQGEQAIDMADALHPHLVLMDIQLSGVMDGIEAAQAIRNKLFIPIVFLTAFAADDILARAKLTEPFGYILKPFSERELRTVLEMALYKHENETRLRLSEANLVVTLNSIGDAVIATDTAGLITRMNPIAERLTGWPLADALGQPLMEVFRIVNTLTRLPSDNPVERVIEHGEVVGLAYHTTLLARDGREHQVADSCAPIRDEAEKIIGMVLVFNDVTEKYRMEMALQQSEKRLRDIFDGLGPDMFVGLLSTEGNVVEANRQALTVANLKLEDVLGKPVEETFWFNYSVEVKQQVRAAVVRAAGGEASRFDLKIRGAEDQFFILDFSIQPFRDESGKVTLLVPSAIDITERKRSEVALQESERRFRSTLEHVQMLVVSVDVAGNITFCNDFLLARTGWSRAEVIGQNWFNKFLPGYASEVALKKFQQAMASGDVPLHYENEIITRGGGLRLVRWNNTALRDVDGVISGTVSLGEDITDRWYIEAALRGSEERLRLALDAAHMGIFDWDVPNKRITWSRWHEELWGFKLGEFDGTYKGYVQRIHADDMPGINAEIARCIVARTPFVREFRVVWPDGSTHWISGRGEFTFDSDGQPLHMRGAVVEITARKLTEEKIRSQLDELMRWQQITLGRESRVRELKMEVNTLLAQRGETERYSSEVSK